MNICLNLKKEEPKKITTTKELAQYILENGNDVEKMSEEDRSRMDAQITAKLQSGKKLSQKEMDYLRKTNPIMYAHVLRVQRMAEAVEEQLKHAKSKEEADQIISSALSGISKNDPDREYILRLSIVFRQNFINQVLMRNSRIQLKREIKREKKAGMSFLMQRMKKTIVLI